MLDLTDIPAARQALLERRAVASAGLEPSPTVVRRDHFAPGLNGAPEVRVRHYRPAGRHGVLPCLYWIHGGGHVLGQIEQDDLAMEHIVDAVGTGRVSPYTAPTRATDLTGLPPAYLAVGDLDLFIDEALEYAQRLQQADVPTELHVPGRHPRLRLVRARLGARAALRRGP